MSWAAGRRLLIALIVGAVLLIVLGAFTFSAVYKAPSCTDGKQNQDETGVDCGGSCAYACAVDASLPTVTFARAVHPTPERTDLIAEIQNPNAAYAVKGAHYTAELFARDGSTLATKEGTIDLPPRGSGPTPLFIANLYRGNAEVAQAFISFDDSSLYWYRYTDTRALPEIDTPDFERIDPPRVRAQVSNPTASTIQNIRLVATVFDEKGVAIGASETRIESLAPRATASAVFTWNSAFLTDTPRASVRAILPLP